MQYWLPNYDHRRINGCRYEDQSALLVAATENAMVLLVAVAYCSYQQYSGLQLLSTEV